MAGVTGLEPAASCVTGYRLEFIIYAYILHYKQLEINYHGRGSLDLPVLLSMI